MPVAWYKEILTKMLRSDWFLDISQIKELPHEMDMSWDRKAVVKNYTKFLASVITRMQSPLPQIRKAVVGAKPHWNLSNFPKFFRVIRFRLRKWTLNYH